MIELFNEVVRETVSDLFSLAFLLIAATFLTVTVVLFWRLLKLARPGGNDGEA